DGAILPLARRRHPGLGIMAQEQLQGRVVAETFQLVVHAWGHYSRNRRVARTEQREGRGCPSPPLAALWACHPIPNSARNLLLFMPCPRIQECARAGAASQLRSRRSRGGGVLPDG